MGESEWGHPTPRQGDCVPLHPLLNNVWSVIPAEMEDRQGDCAPLHPLLIGYICAMIV
jgi:hypothetical protein